MSAPANSDPLSERTHEPISSANSAATSMVVEGGSKAKSSSSGSGAASAHEASASVRLEERGLSGAWEQRALWLESEASAQTDPAARARLLIAASEIRAMCGARADARRLALRAAGAPQCPSIGVAQARALAHGDAAATVKSLREEARAAKAPTVRAHAHYALAEALRLLQHDDAAAEAALEAAELNDPSDLRPMLQRLVRQLGRSTRPPEARLLPDENLRPLRHAVSELARLRGAEAPRPGVPDSSALHLVEAQRAFSRGKRSEAAEALAQLESRQGLSAPIRWLLLLSRSSGPGEERASLDSIAQIVRDSPRRVERRAMAARALAAGDGNLLAEAVGAPHPASQTPQPGSEPLPAFSRGERLSLGALIGRDLGQDPSALDDPALAPLVSALDRMAPTRPPRARPSTPAQAEFVLGRAASRLQSFAEYDVPTELGETDYCDTLLRLERARERRDSLELARHLPRFASRGQARAECCYVAGVWTERAAQAVAARELYRLALPSAATREPAVRALSRGGADAAAMFRSLSAHTSDPARRAGLLIEALFRLQPEAAEFDALAEEAARSDPEQVLAHHLAENAARVRGDRGRVARWLTRQRELAREGDEHALAALREALFSSQTVPESAAVHLEEVLPYATAERALRRRRESWAEVPGIQRAHARRRAAQAAGSREREHAWFEAMTAYVAAGDARAASLCARELGPLGAAWVERLGNQPEDLEWLLSFWTRELEQARGGELVAEIQERLASVELARGMHDQAAFWQHERLKLEPGSLSALRFLAIQSMGKGREAELERIAAELSTVLDGPALQGYAFLAGRLAIDRGAYSESRAHAERAARGDEPPLWALRLRAEHARDDDDHRAQLSATRDLREHAREPLDVVALSLRAAEAAEALGDRAGAAEDLARAHAVASEHVVVLTARADLVRGEAPARAGDALEALAAATRSPALRVDLWLQVAVLWMDTAGELPRALAALEQAAAASPLHPGLVTRVRELLSRAPELEGLRALAQRLRVEEGPSLAAELARARALADEGRDAEARSLVTSLLSLHPRHAGALELSGSLHFRQGAWDQAELAWLNALDTPAPDDDTSSLLRNLARLYEEQLDNPARKSQIYLRLLEREPDDALIRRRLVQLLSTTGQHDEAAREQRELLQRAGADEERRRALLELVELLEQIDGGAREARELLERAQRTWPENVSVLRATVEHYRRSGDAKTARVVGERAVNAARNAIQAGRVEAHLFQMLDTAARLAGDPGLAHLARAALAALHGQPSGLDGAGVAAADASFDELFAPPPLSAAFRRFLYEAGGAFERTYAIDPHVLDPRPLPEPEAAAIRRVTAAFGLPEVRVMVSAEIGFDCVYLHAEPGCVIFGESLLAHDNQRARDFALFRALKLAQINSSALAHMPDAEVWAAVAGFLACFSPPWPAQGAEAQLLVVHRNKIRPHVTAILGPDLSGLAPAVTSNVVPQAAQVGDALRRWASRVALLGIGDVNAAVEAVFRSLHRDRPLPKDAESWGRWIAATDQARDLVGYSISEAYTEARRRAGLAADQR